MTLVTRGCLGEVGVMEFALYTAGPWIHACLRPSLPPGADPGGVQGVRTPALLIMVPFLK